jgi:thioesterase domain-containing protein
MRKRYAVDLPLATLFEAPTIAQCASVLARRLGIVDVDPEDAGAGIVAVPERAETDVEPEQFRSLVTIQKGGDRIPFFCVHGLGGNVLNFRDLSVAMGRGQPFYGLQARGLDGTLTPHDRIEDMAAAYLEEVRTVQPHGPYVFGGYSGGGLVAYEMARQATDAGDSVALVVLIDTITIPLAQIHGTMKMRRQRLRAEGPRYLVDIVGRRVKTWWRHREVARLDEIMARGDAMPRDALRVRVEHAFEVAAEHYELRPWAGRVVLLRANEFHAVFDSLGDSYGWDDVVVGGVEVIRVPGNHDNLLLEPNATTLVRRLRDALDSVGSRHELIA